MLTITFVRPGGQRRICDASVGDSVMMVALVNGIDEVLAECGGSLSCGTCHVYVDEAKLSLLKPPSSEEDAMLDMTVAERLSTSRLSCQLKLSQRLDGLVLHLPDRQV
jgi:2Fe-2S ferredoxin